MNTAVVHYHLNRGGVVQVVANQLLALDRLPAHLVPEQVVLCYGGRREGWPDNLAARLRQIELTHSEIPELDYDEGTNAAPQPVRLPIGFKIRSAAKGVPPRIPCSTFTTMHSARTYLSRGQCAS